MPLVEAITLRMDRGAQGVETRGGGRVSCDAPPRARVLGRTDASKSPQRPRQKRQPPPLGWDALALWFYANMKQIAFEVSTEDFAWYHLPRFGALPAARLRALSWSAAYWYNTADH